MSGRTVVEFIGQLRMCDGSWYDYCCRSTYEDCRQKTLNREKYHEAGDTYRILKRVRTVSEVTKVVLDPFVWVKESTE